MAPSHSSFQPSRFTQLVTHLHEFGEQRRQKMAELYGSPTADATGLAEFWVRNPEQVVEVVRSELTSSLGWRIVEEAVLEHDLGTYLDWAPTRQRQLVARLGLLDPKVDPEGHCRAVMPAALAAIFSDRVRGQRGSLPVLLGRRSDEAVRSLAESWELSQEGSKIELILRICDHFSRAEMVEELLEVLPNPDWIGDALMVLELGGVCHWNQLYNYDLDDQNGSAEEKVVPLMRQSERRQQRQIAETLESLGVLVRIEDDKTEAVLAAVPEELWGGLWELGRRWLMDWCTQGVALLREEAAKTTGVATAPGLRNTLKWWICEAQQGRLELDSTEKRISEETRELLDGAYVGEGEIDWDDVWQLGRELRIVNAGVEGKIEEGAEAEKLLDRRRAGFVAEALLEWCLSYSGRQADEQLVEAIGLDDAWRKRAVALMTHQAEPVPDWMHRSGVDPRSTGGGWLRESGTGPDEIVLFEAGLTLSFVMTAKVLWLDLLSLLDARATYPVVGLVKLMQCVAGLTMFDQLHRVLEEQPAPIYLPFQRASFLLDPRHNSAFDGWVEGIIRHLLAPLGVVTVTDDGHRVRLETDVLRVEDPPRWPAEYRRELLNEIFDQELDFDADGERGPGIRGVVAAANGKGESLAIDEPLRRLLDLVEGRKIASFDGQFIAFEE